MAKQNISDEDKELLKADLDQLLMTNLPDEIAGITDATSELPAPTNTGGRYVTMRNKAKVKAEKTITSLLKFYLSEDIIEEEEYFQAKAEFSKKQLGSMIYSMERMELNIERMMESMDNGELTARMFEVLGGLEKTLLEVIRSQTLYMSAVEDNMKMLSRDYDMYKSPSQPATGTAKSLDADSGVSIRGTKDLMRNIQAGIKEVADAKAKEKEEKEQNK